MLQFARWHIWLGWLVGLPMLMWALTGLVMVAAGAALIEMTYHLKLNLATGPVRNFLGIALNVESAASWIGVTAVMLVGGALFEMMRRRFVAQWHQVNSEIEQHLSRGVAS